MALPFPVIVYCLFLLSAAWQLPDCSPWPRDLPFVEYAWEFCGLAVYTAFDDTTLNSVLDRGQLPSPHGPSRHHRTELEGRDPLVSGECPALSRTIPPSRPSAKPQSSLSAAAHSSPTQARRHPRL